MKDEEKKKEKTIQDLTNKELLEDLTYYVNYAQHQAPSFLDNTFGCIWDDIKELVKREDKK